MVDKIKSDIERDNSSIINVMDWMTRIAIDVLGICKQQDYIPYSNASL